MSQIKTLNGVQYTLPQFNDTGWGANTGNVLTQYMAAIADVTLQLSGGSFTLTADVDFGANFGLKPLYIKTRASNPSSEGLIRLAHTDTIAWRNNVNNDNLVMEVDASDNLLWNRTQKVLLSGAVVNADINASAAIAYSKLALTGSIVSGDLAGSIAVNKLVALGTSLAVVTDGSGFLSTTGVTTTPTELNYVHGVTSAIQTQLTGKASTDLSNVASVSANVPMNSKKFTGLAAGSGNGDSVRYEQLPAVAGTITNWAAYTPTITGCGTVNTVTFGWRRVGDTVEVRGLWLCGTVAASQLTISLPNSITVQSAVLAYDLAGWLMASHTGVTLAYPIRAGGSGNTVDIGKGATGTQFSSYNGNDILSNNDAVYVTFSCPITGWSI